MKTRFYVAAACAAVLAGCGGGSEDCSLGCAGTGGGIGGTGGLISIDRDTALLALQESWYVATVSADIPAFVVATGIGDTSGGVASIIQSNNLISKSAARTTVFVDPLGPTTYNCPVSGQFIISGDVTDPLTITAGDFVVYESTACDSGTGYAVEGTHSVDILDIVGDPASGNFEQTQLLSFGAWEAATPTLTTLIDGDHLAIIDTQPQNSVTVTFSGTTLTVTEDQVTSIITNFSGFTDASELSPFNASLQVTGGGQTSLTQRSFTYITEETMQKAPGQDPTDGIFRVQGLNGSQARFAVDPTLPSPIRVQVDANGSGNYEITTDMTWDEFLNGTVPLGAAEFEAD